MCRAVDRAWVCRAVGKGVGENRVGGHCEGVENRNLWGQGLCMQREPGQRLLLRCSLGKVASFLPGQRNVEIISPRTEVKTYRKGGESLLPAKRRCGAGKMQPTFLRLQRNHMKDNGKVLRKVTLMFQGMSTMICTAQHSGGKQYVVNKMMKKKLKK